MTPPAPTHVDMGLSLSALRRKIKGMRVKMMALIPARVNSKGLPKKNIIPLNGKPLLAYSIESARDVGLFDHVIVSTDSHEIAEIAREYGAETPFMRPPCYAEDKSLVFEVEKDAVEQMAQRGFSADILVSLYPTSPFRHKSMMIKLVSKLLEGYRSVHIGVAVACEPSNIFYEDGDGEYKSIAVEAALRPDKGVYTLGLFTGRWISSTFPTWGTYVEEASMPEHLIDIDTIDDLEAAKRVLDNNCFSFYI